MSTTATAAPSLRAAFEAGEGCLSLRGGARAIDPRIEPLFEKLSSQCSLPVIAQKVIQISEDPDADANDMLGVIQQDVAVAARLMQVVNSAYCGLRNPVSDLKSAVTLLGVERVRNLALTVSMGGVFGRSTPLGRLDPERLWDHSVCVATICRLIAERGDFCNAEEAYLAGLLHDIGLLFINQHLSKLTPRVIASVRAGRSLPDAERQIFAFDHAQVGAYVAWRCRFPDRLVAAIDYHHAFAACPEDCLPLTRVVVVANYLATRYGRGSIKGRQMPAPPEGVLEPMGLNLPALRHVWGDLPEAIANVSQITGV